VCEREREREDTKGDSESGERGDERLRVNGMGKKAKQGLTFRSQRRQKLSAAAAAAAAATCL